MAGWPVTWVTELLPEKEKGRWVGDLLGDRPPEVELREAEGFPEE